MNPQDILSGRAAVYPREISHKVFQAADQQCSESVNLQQPGSPSEHGRVLPPGERRIEAGPLEACRVKAVPLWPHSR